MLARSLNEIACALPNVRGLSATTNVAIVYTVFGQTLSEVVFERKVQSDIR